MPKLIRFMIYHAANGMALGCAALLIAIWSDLFGLGALLETDRTGLATGLLFFQTALTFGAVNMGVAVMLLGESKEERD
ncbi:MAG: hypothetical protein ACPGID_05605 [Rubricella sp.]